MALTSAPAAKPPVVDLPVVVYHIFTDDWDDFTRDWEEAKRTYARLLRERRPRVRLYYEAFDSEEHYLSGDDLPEENYWRGRGEYPL